MILRRWDSAPTINRPAPTPATTGLASRENVWRLLKEPRGGIQVERGCVQSLSNGPLAGVITRHGCGAPREQPLPQARRRFDGPDQSHGAGLGKHRHVDVGDLASVAKARQGPAGRRWLNPGAPPSGPNRCLGYASHAHDYRTATPPQGVAPRGCGPSRRQEALPLPWLEFYWQSRAPTTAREPPDFPSGRPIERGFPSSRVRWRAQTRRGPSTTGLRPGVARPCRTAPTANATPSTFARPTRKPTLWRRKPPRSRQRQACQIQTRVELGSGRG